MLRSLAPPVAAAILHRPSQRLATALHLVDRSYLPTRAMQSDDRDCLRARAEALAG